jgi:hypothetical protein
MILGLLFCFASAALVVALTRRSLGHGLAALLTVGYVYGIVRANLFDGVSHFAFDLGVLALYAMVFLRRADVEVRERSRRAASWLKALVIVPVVMFFVPLQHPLIQFVGLRAAILFLPMIVVGARVSAPDLDRLARWVVVLNLFAVAVGTIEYFVGVERFFPRNELTRIIYSSADVGSVRAFRIPAVFSSAHAFGGMMVATLPLLGVAAASATGTRLVITVVAMCASIMGVFMCGARSPVVHLFLLGALVFAGVRLPWRSRLGLGLVMVVVLAVVSSSERLQRFTTLADAERVTERVRGSANVGVVDAILDYPLGVGLGRAVGTSIPFFLQHLAKPHFGLENEYARIALEQGVIGLAIFLTFIADVLRRGTKRNPVAPPAVAPLFRYFVGIVWATVFIGTGVLTAIPGTALLLLFMGVLLAQPPRTRSASSATPPFPAARRSVA